MNFRTDVDSIIKELIENKILIANNQWQDGLRLKTKDEIIPMKDVPNLKFRLSFPIGIIFFEKTYINPILRLVLPLSAIIISIISLFVSVSDKYRAKTDFKINIENVNNIDKSDTINKDTSFTLMR